MYYLILKKMGHLCVCHACACIRNANLRVPAFCVFRARHRYDAMVANGFAGIVNEGVDDKKRQSVVGFDADCGRWDVESDILSVE